MPMRKWSPIRSAVYGLNFQLVAIWISDWYWGTHNWVWISFYLESGVFEPTLVALAALLPGPVVFFLIAALRNLAVRRTAKKVD